MNLFIHGIDGNIELGNSYTNDRHAGLKADYILANPPFNDGAKGENGWGAKRVPDKDPRLRLPEADDALAAQRQHDVDSALPLSPERGGTAGFVMATGELSNSETARMGVRRLWSSRITSTASCSSRVSSSPTRRFHARCGSCRRAGTGAVAFATQRRGSLIDGRKLGTLIPGSRKQKQLSDEEIEKVAAVYRQFRRERAPNDFAGFCKVAKILDVRGHGYALTPGRYVGAEESDDGDELFEEVYPRLVAKLEEQFRVSEELTEAVRINLADIAYGS